MRLPFSAGHRAGGYCLLPEQNARSRATARDYTCLNREEQDVAQKSGSPLPRFFVRFSLSK